MPNIRDELCRFIRMNEQEQWEQSCDASKYLERFGDDLIPGLIECLDDGHPDVRHQAVNTLTVARPRSDVAVPNLIERLTDDDWLVVTSVILALGDFGPMAAAAIPQIEPWLQSPNEYIRLLAATTIVKLDSNRTEFLPRIREATTSDHPVFGHSHGNSSTRWLDNGEVHRPRRDFPPPYFWSPVFPRRFQPLGVGGKSRRITKRWSA